MIRGTTLFTACLAITWNSSKFFACNGASGRAYCSFGASAREGDCLNAFAPAFTLRRLSEASHIQHNSVIAFFEIISLYADFVNHSKFRFAQALRKSLFRIGTGNDCPVSGCGSAARQTVQTLLFPALQLFFQSVFCTVPEGHNAHDSGKDLEVGTMTASDPFRHRSSGSS